GALLELANVALRERVEARRERDAPERGACAFAGYEEVRARRKRRPLPAAVARPAADAGVAHPGARPDLAVAERALLDEPAHRRDRGVGVRPAPVRPHQHGGGVAGLGPYA